MEELKLNHAIIKYVEKKNGPIIIFEGRLRENKTSDKFQKWFNPIANILISNDVSLLKWDITKLEYINSMCISELIKWLRHLYISFKDKDIRVLIFTKKNDNWQKITFNIFSQCFPDIVEIR